MAVNPKIVHLLLVKLQLPSSTTHPTKTTQMNCSSSEEDTRSSSTSSTISSTTFEVSTATAAILKAGDSSNSTQLLRLQAQGQADRERIDFLEAQLSMLLARMERLEEKHSDLVERVAFSRLSL